MLPAKVIVKLTAIARNFFWGGKHDKRCLSYVAWKEITKPKGMGGLGLRSLTEMNRALVLKMAWKLARGDDTQWVKAMHAKYFPRGAFWSIQRRSRCSKFWKQIMQLRPILAVHVVWQIGSGNSIDLYSQPWFPGWQGLVARTSQQRKEKLSSLIDSTSREWDFDSLQQLFGYSQALAIATMDTITPSPPPAPDTLLFTYSMDGKFSVKKAYQMLKGEQSEVHDKQFWNWLWSTTKLTPKLKVFIWRCIKGALPVMAVLSYRIRHISPICPICQTEPESIMHALFHCEFAKRAWFVSAIPLRTDGMVGGFKETVEVIFESLSEGEVCSFVSTLWAIWRMRNEVIHGGKRQSLEACMAFYKKERNSCQTRILTSGIILPNQAQLREVQVSVQGHPTTAFQCYVDGSWTLGGVAGIGVYLLKEGKVTNWISKSVLAVNPAQTEAKALLEGYHLLVQEAGGEGVLFSDSKETVLALQGTFPQIAD